MYSEDTRDQYRPKQFSPQSVRLIKPSLEHPRQPDRAETPGAMELSEQSRSRLEETKVEKRQEDEEYLRKHPEIAAAFRMLSKV